jgi:hypothetical protein
VSEPEASGARAARRRSRQERGAQNECPDPVRRRRAQIARVVDLGLRVGYGLFVLAIVLFVVGLVAGYWNWLVTVIVASLVIGSIVLAPAIVFNYAVRAAEREDTERGL